MSHVYTRSAVALGQTPRLKNFSIVVSELRTAINGIHEKLVEEIPAATIFGSCATGQHNVCSDIDVIVLVNDTSVHKNKTFEEVNNFEPFANALKNARNNFVQVSVYPVILSDLRSARTKNDRQFLAHVVIAARSGGLICGNHGDFVFFFKEAPPHTLLRASSYIERKIEKLEQRLFCCSGLSEDEEARMWLDTYQAPFHALRRLFDLTGVTYYKNSKQGLVTIFKEIATEKYFFATIDLMNRWEQYISFVNYSKGHKGSNYSLPFVKDDVYKAIMVLKEVLRIAQNVA